MRLTPSAGLFPNRRRLRLAATVPLLAVSNMSWYAAASAAPAVTSAVSQPGAGLWTNTDTPYFSAALDTVPVELGVKFRSSSVGIVTSVGFYKGRGNGACTSAPCGTTRGRSWLKSNSPTRPLPGGSSPPSALPSGLHPGATTLRATTLPRADSHSTPSTSRAPCAPGGR